MIFVYFLVCTICWIIMIFILNNLYLELVNFLSKKGFRPSPIYAIFFQIIIFSVMLKFNLGQSLYMIFSSGIVSTSVYFNLHIYCYKLARQLLRK